MPLRNRYEYRNLYLGNNKSETMNANFMFNIGFFFFRTLNINKGEWVPENNQKLC